MLDRHEPDKQFVENLEWQIGSEVRRRNRTTARRSPLGRLARAAALVVVSMAFGAVAMGASYQIEESWRKELLVAGLEVHLELARQRIQLAVEELARVEVRVGIGTAPPLAREQPRLFVAESEVQVRRMELELEEINLSGRESRDDVSAPLVSGRDFVSERLGLEMQIERQRLEMVVAELQAQARRVEVGTMTPFELNGLQLAVGVAEDRLVSVETRLQIRQSFLAGEMATGEAELQALIGDAQSRESTARRRLDVAQRELGRIQRMSAVGVAGGATVQQVELAVSEAEAELRLAEIELGLLRQALQASDPQR